MATVLDLCEFAVDVVERSLSAVLTSVLSGCRVTSVAAADETVMLQQLLRLILDNKYNDKTNITNKIDY